MNTEDEIARMKSVQFRGLPDVEAYLRIRAAAEQKAFERDQKERDRPKSRQERRAEERATQKVYDRVMRKFALYEKKFVQHRELGHRMPMPADELESAFLKALTAKYGDENGKAGRARE